MKQQNGVSLVITLILLSVITLAALSAMQNSGIEARMTANYRHSAEVFHETNNELTAQIRNATSAQEILSLLDDAEKNIAIKRLSHSTLPVTITISATNQGNCITCMHGYDLAQFEGMAVELSATGSATPLSSTQYTGISVIAPKP